MHFAAALHASELAAATLRYGRRQANYVMAVLSVASFIKAVAAFKRDGKIGDGLTFHGLRHTVGILLVEAGYDLDTVRRWLGQKTLAMAIHYSETGDTPDRMDQAIKKLDPLGSKSRP